METPAARIDESWDLTNCDREPIHVPGAIQSHGALIAIGPDHKIRIVSENTQSIFGLPPNELLGRSLFDIFSSDSVLNSDSLEKFDQLTEVSPFKMAPLSDIHPEFRAYAFRTQNYRVFEIEPTKGELADRIYHTSRSAIATLSSSRSPSELYNRAVSEIRKLTSFDRVTIYKFDEHWNGHVLAEAKSEVPDSYLDLHFPASDIPKQARELYLLNRVRIIPDVHYVPAKLVGDQNARELDLSSSALRSISPIHIEYLKNMPATASMSISLIVGGKLWGLISCTHLSGKLPLSFETRAICDLIGEFVSSLLPLRDAEEARLRSLEAMDKQADLLASMAQADDFAIGLMSEPKAFLEAVSANGAVIYSDGTFKTTGQVPDQDELEAVVAWLDRASIGEIYCTDSFPAKFGTEGGVEKSACGLLAFPVSTTRSSYVMWFRPEVAQTVKWGGDPRKPVEVTNGQRTLHPRKSFEAWKEVVRGRSLPWTKDDLQSALMLKRAILDVVLKKYERISLLNRELERSNTELDSFAYAASHDLKEPLRGITNYASLLSRSLKGKLNETDTHRFETISRLTDRMESLINSLLDYSQIGRAEMSVRATDMNEVVRSAIDNLQTRIDETKTVVTTKPDLPTIPVDRIQALEVFTNLVSNAIKYNDAENKVIEIGYTGTATDPVFFVKDNGIGIAPDNQKSIFQIFKRLHRKESYGGGSGTGLTIAKKIIERHSGRIWLNSAPGQGTTFFFTFGDY